MRGVDRLSERERAVLRLLASGHDAKSAARALDLSVHSINERLRDARAKLGVTSSREAARRLAQVEGAVPQGSRPEKIGLDAASAVGRSGVPRPSGAASRSHLVIGGIFAMSLIVVAAVALTAPAASAPPRVVATTPAAGSIVPAGPFTLSVTFDRPMRDGSYSFVRSSPETYPDCPGRPVLSKDRRTFSMRCTGAPGRAYDIGFNRPPYRNFRGVDGREAQAARLRFTTRR